MRIVGSGEEGGFQAEVDVVMRERNMVVREAAETRLICGRHDRQIRYSSMPVAADRSLRS